MLKIRAIDHLVLRVRDIDLMRRFYCEVLGAEHLAWRPELGMSHLRAGASMIDLVVAGEGAPGRNMDHFCLRVEPFDQDAIVAHLAAHGVTVGEIARRFGAEGNGVSIYVTDPEGNVIELKGPSDGAPRPPA
jgi:glyoxylase I family protein